MVLGSSLDKKQTINGDGIVSDLKNQNLWVYTADCLPILFADKQTRNVAAIHCGRLGLEKQIIKNTINLFEQRGSLRTELLVSIGPSISKLNYALDIKTINKFKKSSADDEIKETLIIESSKRNHDINNNLIEKTLFLLDIKGYALKQLCNEGIPSENIEISEKCTYDLPNEFHSWRRTKTKKRQWSFICS